MPQYRYAYDEHGVIADVLQLSTDRAGLTERYTCIGCGAPLVAKTRGDKREKHFAHKAATRNCTEETYLHRLAKQVFLEEYHWCLAHDERFDIELTYPRVCRKYKENLGQSCHIGSCKKSHDLTQYYDTIKLEQRDGQFVPDLLLGSSYAPDRMLYVEIAVTHFLAEPKAASGHKIIEIPIETEDSIATIRRHRITEADASFVNFSIQAVQVVDADCRCALEPYYCLLVYASGKSHLLHKTLAEIAGERKRLGEQVTYARLRSAPDISASFDRGSVFAEMLKEAAGNGFPVRNCFLCRHADNNRSWQTNLPVYCHKHRGACGSNEAVTCESFQMKAVEPKPQHLDQSRK